MWCGGPLRSSSRYIALAGKCRKRRKQVARWHRLPSFAKQANRAILAILLVGWKLIEALIQPMAPGSSHDLSLWHRTALAVETVRMLLWGQWTGKTVQH